MIDRDSILKVLLVLSLSIGPGLFLAMAMMGPRFWEVGDQALFIFANLALQVLMVTIIAAFIIQVSNAVVIQLVLNMINSLQK